MGIWNGTAIGMKHLARRDRGTADWLLAAVRALVLVSEIRAPVIQNVLVTPSYVKSAQALLI